MARIPREEWLQPEGLARIRAWKRDGLSDEQIAGNIGIGRTTLTRWRVSSPELTDALRRGRDDADIEIENALYRRAYGFTTTEVKVEYECGVEVKRTETTKEVPPDVGAACFWLKNRRPDVWRDKHEVQADVDSEIRVVFGDDEESREILEAFAV